MTLRFTQDDPTIGDESFQDDFDRESAVQSIDPTRKWVLLATVSNLAIGVLLIVLAIFNGSMILSLNSRKVKAFVQVENGDRVATRETSLSTRSDASIKKFVSEILAGLLTWDVLEFKDNQIDRGISIANQDSEKLLTTSAYESSFALSDTFRIEYQKSLAGLIPQEVFLGQIKSVYSVKYISDPVPLKPGLWEVGVVGNILLFNVESQSQKAIPFNRSVQVRSIQPPIQVPSELRNQFHELVYRTQLKGLEIVDIRDIDLAVSSEVRETK